MSDAAQEVTPADAAPAGDLAAAPAAAEEKAGVAKTEKAIEDNQTAKDNETDTDTATKDDAPQKVDETRQGEQDAEIKPDDKPESKAETADDDEKKKQSDDQKTYINKRVFDPKNLPQSDDPVLMRRQVEFYFGDANLPTDKFMWEQTGGEENKPVKVSLIHTFGRMKRFTNYENLVEALRESTELEITGEPGKETITRKTPYERVSGHPERKPGQRTLYVKGFGDEEADTQIEIEDFFRTHGDVTAVRLRRAESTKLFKGSVFVEFRTEESAKKFLSLDPPPKWKGNDLKIMTKAAYCEEKSEQIKNGEIKASDAPPKFFEGRGGKKPTSSPGGRGNSRGDNRGGHNHNSKGRDNKDWNGKRDDGQRRGFGNKGRFRGRGHFGRGRGGRGGSGGGRGGHRGEKPTDPDARPTDPNFAPSNGDSKPVNGGASDPATNGKRPRNEGAAPSGEPPAKKVAADAS